MTTNKNQGSWTLPKNTIALMCMGELARSAVRGRTRGIEGPQADT